MAPPSGEGIVTGGITPCTGVVLPSGSPHFAAGTVVVFRGTTTQSPSPADEVASSTVAANGEYRFTLAAGTYMLVGHYAAGANVQPSVAVTVKAGQTTTINIPNECF